jgi:hypothetical protein
VKSSEQKEHPLRKCELCGKTDDTVDFWVGGYLTFAHHKCAEIANLGVHAYLRKLLWGLNGMEILRQDLNQVEKELHKLEAKPT